MLSLTNHKITHLVSAYLTSMKLSVVDHDAAFRKT